MRRWGMFAVSVTLAVAAGAPLSGCTAAEPPEEESPPATVCAAAAALVDDGDPEAAIALIDRYRAPAIARLEAGAGIADDRTRAVACESQRDEALLTAPTPDEKTAPVEAVDAWNTTLTSWLTPLGTLLAWATGLTAALIVFARLLVFVVPWPALRPRWRRSAPFTFPGSWWPLPVLFLGAVVLVGAWGFLAGTPAQWPLAVVGGLLAAFATWRTVHWFGGRPRVVVAAVDKEGSPSSVRSAQVAALTVELGAGGPGSVESGSSDLSQLTDATAKVSDNALISFLTGIVDFVVNVSPWHVSVTEIDDTTSLVGVRWNGRPVGAATIRSTTVLAGVSGAPADLMQRLQAAVVATTLATHYADMRGLYGATNWRSVGLAFAAPFATGPARLALLTRAVELDPANALARRQRDNLRHADPEDMAATDEYLRALEREANLVAPLSGDRPPFAFAEGWSVPRPAAAADPYPAPGHLLARTLLLWATALCNRLALGMVDPAGPAATPATTAAAHARVLEQLVDVVAHLKVENTANADPSSVSSFLGAMRGRTAIVLRRLHDNPAYRAHVAHLLPPTQRWYDTAAASGDPGMSYRLACRAAMRGLPVDDLLAVAFLRTDYVAWAPKDPELFSLRDSHWSLLHPDIPTDVWKIEPLATHRRKLRGIGIRTAGQLADAGRDVRKALGLDRASFAHLRKIARLAARLEERTPAAWKARVPLIFAALIAEDVDTVGRLRAAEPSDLTTPLTDAVRGVPRPAAPGQSAPGQSAPGQSAPGSYVPPAEAVATLHAAWTS